MADSISPAQETATDIASAASLIAAGNITSRVLGLVRETVIAYLFGATGLVSPEPAASTRDRSIPCATR